MTTTWACPYCNTVVSNMKCIGGDYIPTCGQKTRKEIPKRVWHIRFLCKCKLELTYFNMRKIEINEKEKA